MRLMNVAAALRKGLALAAAAILLSTVVTLITSAPAFADGPELTLAKAASDTTRVGGTIQVTLTADNTSQTGATNEFNVSFRDELPAGVTYVPGSTTPADIGDPVVSIDPGDGHQTLVWQDTSDVRPGAATSVAFEVAVDPDLYPVGSTVDNTGDVYAQTDPTVLPDFDDSGDPVAGSYTETASSGTATTTVTALTMTKSTADAPEGELLRGVHDHSTVYSLQVTNNDVAATRGVQLVDYLPAGLEFLGCGTVDNTSGGAVEYPTAPRLDAVPDVTADCLTPDTVETVSDPTGLPAGIYTRIAWTLEGLPAGETTTVRYRAGIPLRANALAFPGATPPPAGLGQAANLDNNTGPSTRETSSEQALTNRAEVSGTYFGDVADGTPRVVSDTDSVTVSAEDVRLRKDVDVGSFSAGDVATYTLTVETSEYDDATDIAIVDQLPDGLCPLSSATDYSDGADPVCAVGADPVGADYGAVTEDGGAFTVPFTSIELAHNGTAVIVYQAGMRSRYDDGEPTASGDAFTNTVSLEATTTSRPIVGDGGATGVQDESSSTIAAGTPTVTKALQPDVTPYSCSASAEDYVNPTDTTDSSAIFDDGSQVCFLLTARFPDTSSSKDPVVTDVLPAGLTYVDGSAELTSENTTASALVSTAPLTWNVGTDGTDGRFVAPGGVFQVRFAVTVSDPAPGPGTEVLTNRVKLTGENTDGTVGSRRDEVDLAVAAAPPTTIEKSATRLTDPAGPLADGDIVRGDDQVEYALVLGNDGTADDGNDIAIVGPDVWDVLPAGITCADISEVSDSGSCTDPGDTGQPPFSAADTLSAVRWDLPDSVVIQPAAERSVTYVMTIPTAASVALTYTNTAAVASYGSRTNIGTVVQHRPADNVDTTTAPADVDAPAAADNFTVVTQSLELTKTNVTALDEAGNRGPPSGGDPAQAVIGEEITYTVTGTVPAHSTVYSALLTDSLPTGVELLDSEVASSTDGEPPGAGVPTGFTFDSSTAQLTFPAAYTNGSDVEHLFVVTIRARVTTAGANTHGTVRTNTATFSSLRGPDGDRVSSTATSEVQVVEPAPQIAKVDDAPSGVVVALQPIRYTLTAGNGGGRPPLHDAFVVDCVPEGMTVTAIDIPSSGTAAGNASDGSDGCAAGSTRIVWNVGDLAGGGQETLSYTARVDADAVALSSYTNIATLTGSDLDDDKASVLDADNPLERVYTSSAQDSVTVAPAQVTKVVDESTATIGESRTYTVRLVVPRDVNFFDAAIIDQVPAGIDLDSISLTAATCTRADGVACSADAVRLDDAPGPDGSTLIGFGYGDQASSPSARTLTATYTAVVSDIGANARGAVLTNTVHAQWDLTDGPDPTSAGADADVRSNDATASVTLTEPELGIDKTVSDPTPEPGETFTYTVAVSNSTSMSNISDGYDATVVDTVPDGVVVDPASISNGGVLAGETAEGGGAITWVLAGPINAGTPATLTYEASLSSPTPVDALTNTADVTEYASLAHDDNTDRRTYDGPEDTATVQAALPHVSVTKAVVDGDLAYLGDAKTWQVTVTSDGDATARAVDVSDVLPPNWDFAVGTASVAVNGSPLGGDASAPVTSTSGSVQTLSWTDLADLPVGQQLVITFAATPGSAVVDEPGVGHSVDQTNTASVTAEDAAGNRGPRGGSYAGPDATAVAHIDSADVEVTKSHAGSPVAGEPFDWTVEVSNSGPDPAVGPFTVTDTLPPGLVSATATGTGWTCSTSTATLTCTRSDTLAAGTAFPSITVTGVVPPGAPDGTPVVNDVSAFARTYDPDTSNNQDSDEAQVSVLTDLAIVKSLTGEMVAGSNASYSLQVTNNGPSVHRGQITVLDTVPDGTTFVAAGGTGWTLTRAGDQLMFTRSDDRPLGPMPVITVTVRVDGGQTAEVENTADVEGSMPDPDLGNNTSVDRHVPQTSADLILQKAHQTTPPDAFTPGANGVYRFTVVNNGPSDAQAPQISDTLPDNLTYVSSDSVDGSWTCAAPNGTDVTCDLAGALAAGGQAVVDVTVVVDSSAPDGVPIVNTGRVDSTTPDPAPENNEDTDSTDAERIIDLAITKSHTGVVMAGDGVTFTLEVANNGPSDSTGPIVVRDLLPSGLTYVNSDTPAWSCSTPGGPRVVRCAYDGGLTAGETAPPLRLIASVDAGAGPASLVNRAVVDVPDLETDGVLGNNSSTDPTEVVDDVELTIDKSATQERVLAGTRTAFVITVSNDGPSDADDVTVTDTLPAGMSIVSASGEGWTCSAGPVPNCTLPVLEAGATSSALTLTVDVGSRVPDDSVLTNTASVSTSTDGDLPAGNTDTAEVGVDAVADLALAKRHPGIPLVVAGQETTFVLDVSNGGPSTALGAQEIVDDLPPGMSYLSATGGWTCSASTIGDHERVTCLLPGDLAPGQTAPELMMRVLVEAPAPVGLATNAATVTSPTEDPDVENNSDEVEVRIARAADLSISKTHTGDAVVGEPLTFTLAVRNDGPSEDPGVVVEDALPAGLRYVSAEGTDWTCESAGAQITCELGVSLAPDTDAPPITLVVDVLPAAYPEFTNGAQVDGNAPDIRPDNNQDTDRVILPPLVNLTLSKRHAGVMAVGESGRYLMAVHNEGPTPDPGPMTITDRLPTGLTYSGFRGAGWDCTAAGRLVTCTHDGLPVGGRARVVLLVDVGPAAYPSVTNVAAVRTPSPETRASDNVGTDTVAVAPLIDLGIEKDVVEVTAERAVYDIAVTNNGPNDTVEPIVMVDDLPADLHFVRATGPGWSCSEISDTVTCIYPDQLGVGDSATVRLVTTVTADAADEIVNVATVSGGGDPDGATDDAQVSPPEQLRPPSDPVPGVSSGGADGGGWLPDTGGPAALWAALGLLLLTMGGALMVSSRRHRQRQP